VVVHSAYGPCPEVGGFCAGADQCGETGLCIEGACFRL
jgi:hypothetical protein